MRKIAFGYFLLMTTVSGFAQLKSYVDERIELFGIVFRLAGAEEYVNNEVANYAVDIDAYFASYKNHPLIKYVKEIRERDEVAYNAVAPNFIFVEIKNGQVRLAPNADLDCLLQDPRWTKKTFLNYIKLLNRFYKDTKFRTFFDKHKALYAEVEKRFDAGFVSNIHTEWFNDFFGQALIASRIYISLTNGRSNYGGPGCPKMEPQGSIIIGCSDVDSGGIPVFNHIYQEKLFYTVIHELCHIFTSPIIEEYLQDMMPAANIIFPFVKEALANVAYGSASAILVEGINNLCTNMYFREYPLSIWSDDDGKYITLPNEYQIRSNEYYGFIWMGRFVRFMENFYANRNIYPYFQDFMPQIVAYTNSVSGNIEKIIFEYEHSNPYVVNVFPALHSVVSADIKEIRVDFSHRMHNCYGVASSKDTTAIYPETGDGFWTDDNRTTFIIPVTLEKGKSYGVSLPQGIFQSADKYWMKEDFEILFKTGE
jgi:hypothetical protein